MLDTIMRVSVVAIGIGIIFALVYPVWKLESKNKKSKPDNSPSQEKH